MPETISFTLTEREVVAARQVQYLGRAVSWRSLGRNALVVLFLWLIVFGLNFEDSEPIAAAVVGTALLVLVAMLIALGYYRAGQHGRRIFRQQRTLREEQQVTWSDDGLDLRTASVSSSMPWSYYDSWQQDGLGYVLYLSDYSGYLLPRRSFTDAQWNDLGATLARNNVRRRGSARVAERSAQRPGVNETAPARRWWRGPSSWPARVALLWMMLTILIIADALFSRPAGSAGPCSSPALPCSPRCSPVGRSGFGLRH